MRASMWRTALALIVAATLGAPASVGCSGSGGDELPPKTGIATTSVDTSSNSSTGGSDPGGGLCACVQAVFDGAFDTPCDTCYIGVKDPGKACEEPFHKCEATEYCNDTLARSVPQCLIDCKGDAPCEWQCLTWDGDGDPIGSAESIQKLKAYLACACNACAMCVPEEPQSCIASGEGGAGGSGGSGGAGGG